MKRSTSALVVVTCLALATVGMIAPARAADEQLRAIYNKRTDLQALFRSSDWSAIKSSKTSGLSDLYDWAREYGCREYPAQLGEYATTTVAAATTTGPTLTKGKIFNFAQLTADSVLVIDEGSGETLLSHNAQRLHPIASLTKLMTAMVALDHGLDFAANATVDQDDTVGGAMLRIQRGTALTVRDLFNAMLVGSANDAAHAVSRQCGMTESTFIAAMNSKAAALGLTSARFSDPTGLDLGNVATATDVATMMRTALNNYSDIRRSASSPYYDILLSDTERHHIINTNALLTDSKNGLYVLGGKTGYLNESGWNLVVKMQDKSKRPLMVVIFGASDKTHLFNEAAKAARWAWTNYKWPSG